MVRIANFIDTSWYSHHSGPPMCIIDIMERRPESVRRVPLAVIDHLAVLAATSTIELSHHDTGEPITIRFIKEPIVDPV